MLWTQRLKPQQPPMNTQEESSLPCTRCLSHLEQLFSPKLEDGGQLILAKELLSAVSGGSRAEDGTPACVHALDDQVVQHHLLLGPVQDVFFYTATCQEPAHRIKWDRVCMIGAKYCAPPSCWVAQ